MFRPGAWKITEDNRLVRVSRGESINQPDWANQAALDGVVLVLKVDTLEKAEQRIALLRAMEIPDTDIAFYRQYHGLEES